MDKTWLLSTIGVVLVAELIAGRHRNLYRANDYIVNGLCILLSVTVRPFFAMAIALAISAVLPDQRSALGGIPFWIALPAIVLIAEFCTYWVHRISHMPHRFPYLAWLWPLHRTHHSARYVNVLLHFRTNLFWGFVSPLSWVHGLAYYLGMELAAGISITLFSLWGIVTHSNFRWDDAVRAHPKFGSAFRGMEHILVSPGIHHTHHGYGPDGKSYMNFGLLLSVFDWLFGTLHIPKGRPAKYGIPGAAPHWAEEVFYPLYRQQKPREE